MASKDLRAFCACRAIPPRPLAPFGGKPSGLKHPKTLSATGGRAGVGFPPGIQKPTPAHLIRPDGFERIYELARKRLASFSAFKSSLRIPSTPMLRDAFRLQNISRLFRAVGFARTTDESMHSPPVVRAKTGVDEFEQLKPADAGKAVMPVGASGPPSHF